MKRRSINEVIDAMSLVDIYGESVQIPSTDKFVHMQFRRFSGCPICSIHMGQLKSRKQELELKGIKEVIFFYSDDKDMKNNLSDIPFALISDSSRKWYEKFGVEQSLLSVLNPLAWPAATKGFILNIGRALALLPKKDESMFGLPADFLISPDGKIIDLHYGTHAYDQWTVDELLLKAEKYKGNYSNLEPAL